MSGHAGMPVLPLSELEWIGLVNEDEDVLSEPRKNGRRGVFFLDFYLSWMYPIPTNALSSSRQSSRHGVRIALA